jgi:predicted nucleic acid-binding protein
MPYFTYDTSVCIARNLSDFRKMPQNFRLSAIVMMELMAGELNESRRKFFNEIFHQFQKNNLIIVPNADDWLLAAKVLQLLTDTRRRLQKGKLHKLPPGASQRIALDVLIAVVRGDGRHRSSPRIGSTSRRSNVTATPRLSKPRSSSGNDATNNS